MATKVVMAQLSPTMEEGKLIEWKISEGDAVSQGDIVAEIETDKANMDVEAMGAGVLRKIVVQGKNDVFHDLVFTTACSPLAGDRVSRQCFLSSGPVK